MFGLETNSNKTLLSSCYLVLRFYSGKDSEYADKSAQFIGSRIGRLLESSFTSDLVSVANEEHLKILKAGVDAWNSWRWRNPGLQPDLNAVNVHGEDISVANLAGVNLSNANLCGAILSRAHLYEANLIQADLTGASLYGATSTTRTSAWRTSTGRTSADEPRGRGPRRGDPQQGDPQQGAPLRAAS